MAQDSKAKRYLRRLKRENSLLFRQTQVQQYHLNVFAHMAEKMHGEQRYREELGNSPEEAL